MNLNWLAYAIVSIFAIPQCSSCGQAYSIELDNMLGEMYRPCFSCVNSPESRPPCVEPELRPPAGIQTPDLTRCPEQHKGVICHMKAAGLCVMAHNASAVLSGFEHGHEGS